MINKRGLSPVSLSPVSPQFPQFPCQFPCPQFPLPSFLQFPMSPVSPVSPPSFPGNIYIRKQGEPVLIDFGAARQAIRSRSRSLTNIVSAGYAPSEQYGSNQSKQGPWSDLYAVGATMYRCINGKEPAGAPTRQNALF